MERHVRAARLSAFAFALILSVPAGAWVVPAAAGPAPDALPGLALQPGAPAARFVPLDALVPAGLAVALPDLPGAIAALGALVPAPPTSDGVALVVHPVGDTLDAAPVAAPYGGSFRFDVAAHIGPDLAPATAWRIEVLGLRAAPMDSSLRLVATSLYTGEGDARGATSFRALVPVGALRIEDLYAGGAVLVRVTVHVDGRDVTGYHNVLTERALDAGGFAAADLLDSEPSPVLLARTPRSAGEADGDRWSDATELLLRSDPFDSASTPASDDDHDGVPNVLESTRGSAGGWSWDPLAGTPQPAAGIAVALPDTVPDVVVAPGARSILALDAIVVAGPGDFTLTRFAFANQGGPVPLRGGEIRALHVLRVADAREGPTGRLEPVTTIRWTAQGYASDGAKLSCAPACDARSTGWTLDDLSLPATGGVVRLVVLLDLGSRVGDHAAFRGFVSPDPDSIQVRGLPAGVEVSREPRGGSVQGLVDVDVKATRLTGTGPIMADAGEAMDVRVCAVDAAGNVDDDAQGSAALAPLSVPQAAPNGATWTVPAKVRFTGCGHTLLTLGRADDSVPLRAAASRLGSVTLGPFGAQPAAPASLALLAPPGPFVAGAPLQATAQVLDAFGNVVDHGAHDFQGTLDLVPIDAPGTGPAPAVARVTIASGGAGNALLTGATFFHAGEGAALELRDAAGALPTLRLAGLQVLPAAPATVKLDLPPATVTTDAPVVALHACARDAYGNAVADGTRLEVVADPALASPVTATTHACAATLNADLGTQASVLPRSLKVAVHGGPSSGASFVRVLPGVPARVSLQPGGSGRVDLAANLGQVKVTANVQDAHSNPVADATPVTFRVLVNGTELATFTNATLLGASSVSIRLDGLRGKDFLVEATAGNATGRTAPLHGLVSPSSSPGPSPAPTPAPAPATDAAPPGPAPAKAADAPKPGNVPPPAVVLSQNRPPVTQPMPLLKQGQVAVVPLPASQALSLESVTLTAQMRLDGARVVVKPLDVRTASVPLPPGAVDEFEVLVEFANGTTASASLDRLDFRVPLAAFPAGARASDVLLLHLDPEGWTPRTTSVISRDAGYVHFAAVNGGHSVFAIAFDAAAPVVRVTAPASAPSGTAVNVKVNATDDLGVRIVRLLVNGVTFANETKGFDRVLAAGMLPRNGSVLLHADAVDATGKAGSAEATVNILAPTCPEGADTLAPTTAVRVLSGAASRQADGNFIVLGAARFELRATDAGPEGCVDPAPVVTYRLDGGAPTPGTEVKLDQVGTHSLEFFATDAHGNVEPRHTVRFEVLEQEQATGVGISAASASGLDVSVHASGEASRVVAYLYRDGVLVQETDLIPSGFDADGRPLFTGRFDDPGPGSYRVQVVASDADGHEAHAEAGRVVLQASAPVARTPDVGALPLLAVLAVAALLLARRR